MSNEVIITTGTVNLDWADVGGAGSYDVQISKYQDFTTGTDFDGTTATSNKTHTLTGGNAKYYWRWRENGGVWRENNSFIADTTAGTDVALSNEKFLFITKGTETDQYEFETNPLDWEIEESHIYTVKKRNLKGELLSEWITTKGSVVLDFTKQSAIGTNQRGELMRYYNQHSSFYVAVRTDSQDNVNFLYRIWEVEFDKSFQTEKIGGLKLELVEV